MSFYDAYCGTGYEFSTVALAIESGRSNICVVSGTSEISQWILKSNTVVTIRPNAYVTYVGLDKFIVSDQQYSITINGGNLVLMSEYICEILANITISSCNVVLTNANGYITSSNVFIFDNTITCGYLYLSTVITSDTDISYNVSMKNNTVYGNVSLMNGQNTNLKVNLNDNIVRGSVVMFPNSSVLPDIIGYPTVYTLTGNNVDVMSFTSVIDYETSYFLGLSLLSNTIGTLNVTGPNNATICYSIISNNSITYASFNNNDNVSWCSFFDSTITENTILYPTRIGELDLCNLTANTLNDFVIGVMNRCVFDNNTMLSLYVTEGTNNGTSINRNNIIGEIVCNCNMTACEIKDNFFNGSLTFNGVMLDNAITGNATLNIIYNGKVMSDKISKHYNTIITFNNSVTRSNIYNNDVLTLVVKEGSIVDSCKIVANNLRQCTFNAKVVGSTITSNTGSIIFNARTREVNIADNNRMTLKFNSSIKRSIITDNILLHEIRICKDKWNNLVRDNILIHRCM